VPTAAEAKAIYGVDLAARGIQPVRIEIKNGSPRTYWLLDAGLDPDNFSVSEVAYAFRGADGKNKELRATLDAQRFRNPVRPGQTVAGFVLTNLDENLKFVQADLIARGDLKTFSFNVTDPTAELASSRVDFANLYGPGKIIQIDSEAALRDALQRLPCCTTNRDGTEFGDPLNLVLVGEREATNSALLRRDWDPTETLRSTSLWRTIGSFLSGTRYRSSPVSPLYAFGRHQDGSAQKARATIHERNYARFWLTPIRYQDTPVWIGQVSRDIGVKYTLKSPTISTHVIDPDVDEARSYFVEDMAYSQALQRFGYVAGVGAVERDAPRSNLVGDPYFTDGLRAVLFMNATPHSLDQIEWLDWEAFRLRNPTRTFKVATGLDEDVLRARAVVKVQDRIRVAAAVPNDAEIQVMFGVDLVAKGIQPLWLEITNRRDRAFVFLPTGLDPEYFSPREAAFLFRGGLGHSGYSALADHLEAISLNSREPIRPARPSAVSYMPIGWFPLSPPRSTSSARRGASGSTCSYPCPAPKAYSAGSKSSKRSAEVRRPKLLWTRRHCDERSRTYPAAPPPKTARLTARR
jgi:hypothetical protein